MRTLPMIFRLADEMMSRQMQSVFSSPFYESPFVYRLAPWNHISRLQKEEELPKVGKDGYQVSIDVAQFKPSELKVKVLEDSVIVEGKYENREDDHGFSSRQFVRRFLLPKGYDSNKVMSTLSSDGLLTVSVPKPPAIEDKPGAREVPIQQTGPAHLNVKENPVEDNGTKNAS
ncbi:heat shock protein 23-like [Teleopsis dalmanni]|uniref:heat shock protein 23-like n=1 Tax=Teleopsis dalmanni TaxID=139649 RepID=UPI0018CF66DE|nr:heat shock protein 23-like [Teleopsis dalmanni]